MDLESRSDQRNFQMCVGRVTWWCGWERGRKIMSSKNTRAFSHRQRLKCSGLLGIIHGLFRIRSVCHTKLANQLPAEHRLWEANALTGYWLFLSRLNLASQFLRQGDIFYMGVGLKQKLLLGSVDKTVIPHTSSSCKHHLCSSVIDLVKRKKNKQTKKPTHTHNPCPATFPKRCGFRDMGLLFVSGIPFWWRWCGEFIGDFTVSTAKEYTG